MAEFSKATYFRGQLALKTLPKEGPISSAKISYNPIRALQVQIALCSHFLFFSGGYAKQAQNPLNPADVVNLKGKTISG